MNLISNAIINVYSILLLIILVCYVWRCVPIESIQNKLYMGMLNVTIVMLVVDIFSRFDGNLGTFYPVINHIANFSVFLLSPILPSLWLLYVYYQLFQDERKLRNLMRLVVGLNIINVAFLTASQFNGWYYYIDSSNVYHRGMLFILCETITLVLIMTAFILTVLQGKRIEKKAYLALLFFPIPPLLAIGIQTFIYGISIMLNSVVLSLLILFLNVQNHNIHIDYLTGVYNRKKLQSYLQEKINRSTIDHTFSAILIDLDDFKYINDTFGHSTGDLVLETSAKLIKESLRSNDFIARFGGDEFCVVLDISDTTGLELFVTQLKTRVKAYNDSSHKPYKVELSMGYAIYDYKTHISVEDFQKKIDLLMYENKKRNKCQ